MQQDSNSSWVIPVIAFIPTAAGGLWVAWKAIWDRKDKHQADELTREQMLLRDLDAQRTAASKEAADIFERVRMELGRRDVEAVRKDERIDALEKEIDRWIAVARGWQTRSFSLKHALNNTRQEINALLRKAGQTEKVWNDNDLPTTLEEPQP